MSTNTVTCGNCLTENPPGRDFCIECGKPLTASAEEGLRESAEAQEHGGLFGDAGIPGIGVAGTGLVGGAGGIVTGVTEPDDVDRR